MVNRHKRGKRMDSTLAALLGAIIGGLLSVVASWLAQQVQSKAQWLTQEIARRQQLYSEFLDATVCAYADALQHDQIDTNAVSKLYGEMGRMRLNSSEPVLLEAYKILHKILEAYRDTNRSSSEVGELLSSDAVDLYTDFSDACRAELLQLQPQHINRNSPLSFRPMPRMDVSDG
jgi:hypothetical protein